jgi:uncharacterized protein (DUF2384 family)
MPATLPTPARKLEAEANAELVAWARHALGLTYREIAALTGATLRTAQRWGDAADLSRPSAEHRPRLDALRELRRLLGRTFADSAAAATWLHRAVPLLEGARPIDRVRAGDLDAVIAVLAGAHAGAFA